MGNGCTSRGNKAWKYLLHISLLGANSFLKKVAPILKRFQQHGANFQPAEWQQNISDVSIHLNACDAQCKKRVLVLYMRNKAPADFGLKASFTFKQVNLAAEGSV